jgi:hypothetical protein
MSQVCNQSPTSNASMKAVLSRQFAARFVVSSISSVAGLFSLVLTAPVMCRVAAIDPGLEVFYFALVAGWFWSQAGMWSLTFKSGTTDRRRTNPEERRDQSCNRV